MVHVRLSRAHLASCLGLMVIAAPAWAQVSAPPCTPGGTASAVFANFGSGPQYSLRNTDLSATEGSPNTAGHDTFAGYRFSDTGDSPYNGVYYIGNRSNEAGIHGANNNVLHRNFGGLLYTAGQAGYMLIVDPPSGITSPPSSSAVPVFKLRINHMTPGATYTFTVSTHALTPDAAMSMHLVTGTSTGAASALYNPEHLSTAAWTETSLPSIVADSDWWEVTIRTPVAATAHAGAIAFDDLRISAECPAYSPPSVVFDPVPSQPANVPLNLGGVVTNFNPNDSAQLAIYTEDEFLDRVLGYDAITIDPDTGRFSVSYPASALPPGTHRIRLQIQGGPAPATTGLQATYVSASFVLTAAAVAAKPVPLDAGWALGLLGVATAWVGGRFRKRHSTRWR